MKSLYQDYDALAYKPHSVGEERGAINHIKKAKQKTKGLEIVFDPRQHKEFVTGFRKRKQQRRKVANTQLEKKAKQQRLEQRAERRKELKEQLGLPEDYGIQDSDGEQGAAGQDESAAAAKADVKQYQQAGFTTTVSVTNLNTGYSSDEDAAPEESEQQEEEEQQQQHRQQQQRRDRPSQLGSKRKSGKVSKRFAKRHRDKRR